MKILIVDNSVMVRRAISQFAEHTSYEVVAMVSTMEEALEKVTSKIPDVVILDISMPHLDGLFCLEQIIKVAPSTKVLIISDQGTSTEILAKGASHYLQKPIQEFDVLEALTIMTSKKHHTLSVKSRK